jgi:hypothetical protein
MPATEHRPKPSTVTEPADSLRPHEHKGIRIVKEEPQMALPRAPFRFTKIYLEDGTSGFACRDCTVTADSRGQILVHRNEAHGARNFKKPPKVDLPPLRTAPDPILPPRPDGKPAATAPLDMTLREFLAICPDLAAMADLVDRVESERDHARSMLREQEKATKENAHKIAVYPSLQEEVVDLRLMVKDAGRFEEMKAELLELRMWKKKMIAKLSALGFNFTEEEQ